MLIYLSYNEKIPKQMVWPSLSRLQWDVWKLMGLFLAGNGKTKQTEIKQPAKFCRMDHILQFHLLCQMKENRALQVNKAWFQFLNRRVIKKYIDFFQTFIKWKIIFIHTYACTVFLLSVIFILFSNHGESCSFIKIKVEVQSEFPRIFLELLDVFACCELFWFYFCSDTKWKYTKIVL